MHTEASYIVWMRFELYDLFACIEVEASEHKVVATTHKPILPCYKFASTDRNICYFEGLDDCRGLVVV